MLAHHLGCDAPVIQCYLKSEAEQQWEEDSGNADRWSRALGEHGGLSLLPWLRASACPVTAGLRPGHCCPRLPTAPPVQAGNARVRWGGLRAQPVLSLSAPPGPPTPPLCSGSIPDPGGAALGRNSTGRQQAGGLHPPRRKQEQRPAGDNSEQVVQELVVVFNRAAGSCETTPPGSPTAREAVPHAPAFPNRLSSIR